MSEYEWKAGWYVTRLHAIDRDAVPGKTKVPALCGAWVYFDVPPTDWAKRRLETNEVPHCKKCQAIIDKLQAKTGLANMRFTAITHGYDQVVRRVRFEVNPGETLGGAMVRFGISTTTQFLFIGWPLLKGEEDQRDGTN